METGSNLVQVIQPHQTTMINPINPVHHPNNTPGPLQTPTSNLVVMATNVNDNSKQIINKLAREMMESTGLQPTAATATTTTSSILSQSTIINSDLIVKQEYVNIFDSLQFHSFISKTDFMNMHIVNQQC